MCNFINTHTHTYTEEVERVRELSIVSRKRTTESQERGVVNVGVQLGSPMSRTSEVGTRRG